MSISNIRKFKVSILQDSAKGVSDGNRGKTQGLKTGDIVCRQYFNGVRTVYSLLCVLDYGIDEVTVEEIADDGQAPQTKQSPWFIGALLDGDAPMAGELLDFVRITNLFDQSRSGALYLTASDSDSPYMDVIDGIGKNCSLTWPESINNTEFDDPQSQYIVSADKCEVEYIASDNERNRICRIKNNGGGAPFIKQTFSQYIQNPNQVIVSFWTKATKPCAIKMKLAYEDETRTDGEVSVDVGTEWTYHLYPITVDYSGRYKRAITIDLSSLDTDADFYISDFNAILLSNLTEYGNASQIRVGKLSGISDPVFGKLDCYGGYFQKLFASNSAHISGTLTAGDENGFASTFYAGKIHKNAFINSIAPATNLTPIDEQSLMQLFETSNPTGIGNVYGIIDNILLTAQHRDWLYQSGHNRVNKTYTFSFWAYSKHKSNLTLFYNSQVVGSSDISESETFGWHRHSITFKLQDIDSDDIVLSIKAEHLSIQDSSEIPLVLFTAPQLEEGRCTTQYQPTDEIVTHLCEDYGAWFNRGGIGGTIQNPLLKLNADGQGAIEARSKSFRIDQDGSGFLAQQGIKWDGNGNVEFGPNVKLNWSNLSGDAQQNIANKSIKIIGGDTFAVSGYSDTGIIYSPQQIRLTIEENGINSNLAERKWYYMSSDGPVAITSDISDDKLSLIVQPEGNYWEDNSATLIIKAVTTYLGQEYSDTITIRKYSIDGYSVVITSSNGDVFKNGVVDTVLTAQIYYMGNPLSDEYADKYFRYLWHKYKADDIKAEIENWWIDDSVSGEAEIDRKSKTIHITGTLDETAVYVCEILSD